MRSKSPSLSSDVFFPIEIVSREYSGYLLLAAELAARGRTVTIGHKAAVAREMTRSRYAGLLFYKTSRGGAGDAYWQNSWASGDGHQAFVAQDPEAGVIYTNFQDFFEQRPSFRPGSLSRGYFCFGPDDHSFLERHFPNEAEHFFLTGAPRMSLWGSDGDVFYKQYAQLIQERFGSFMLFASSGGFTHEKYLPGRDSEAVWATATEAHHFSEMALGVAREIDVNVIVRPHPADSWEAWSRLSSRAPNLYVTNAFDFAAWTRDAIAVVQPGISTAALEAVCAGVPAVSTHSNHAWLNQWETVPATISHDGNSYQRLMEVLTQALNGQLPTYPTVEASMLVQQKLLHPLSGSTIRIADVLDRIAPHNGSSALPRIRRRAHWRRDGAASDHLSGAVFESPPRFKRDPLRTSRVIADLEAASIVLGRSSPLRVHECAPNCFRISS